MEKQKNENQRDITPKRVVFPNKDHLKTQNKRIKSKRTEEEENVAYDYGNLKSNTEKKKAKMLKEIEARNSEFEEEQERVSYSSNQEEEEEFSQEELEYEDEEAEEEQLTVENSIESEYESERLNLGSFQENSQQYHLTSINSNREKQPAFQQDPSAINRRIMMPQTPLPPTTPQQGFYQHPQENVQNTPYNQYHQHQPAPFALQGETPYKPQNPQIHHQNYTPYNYGYKHLAPPHNQIYHNQTPPPPQHPHYQHSVYERVKSGYLHPTPNREMYPPQTPVNYHHPHPGENIVLQAPPQQFFYQQHPDVYQTHKSLLSFQNTEDIKQEISARSKLSKMRRK